MAKMPRMEIRLTPEVRRFVEMLKAVVEEPGDALRDAIELMAVDEDAEREELDAAKVIAQRVLGHYGPTPGLVVDTKGRDWILRRGDADRSSVDALTADQRRAIMHEELGKQGRGAVVIDGERRSWSVYMRPPKTPHEKMLAQAVLGDLGATTTFKDSRGRQWAVYVGPPPESKTDMHIAGDVLAQFGDGAEFWDAKKRSWRQGRDRFGQAEVLEFLAGNNPDVEYRDRRGRLWVCVEETDKPSEPSCLLGGKKGRWRRV